MSVYSVINNATNYKTLHNEVRAVLEKLDKRGQYPEDYQIKRIQAAIDNKYNELYYKQTTYYQRKKDELKTEALNFQLTFDYFNYSYLELANKAAYFEKYGRRYGLLTEFKINGII